MKDEMKNEVLRIGKDAHAILEGSLVHNKLNSNEVEALLRDIIKMCNRLLAKDNIIIKVGEQIKTFFEEK